ncbi:MAG: hypothetical protein QOJ15_2021, partial [Bradyrhizobium sp.]|nr:hypothetical protein [Bradyrhizobium sp.]
MDFDYSDEQKHLKLEARRFLEHRCRPSAVRAVLADSSLSFDRSVWTGIA